MRQQERLLPWAISVSAGLGASAAAWTVLRLARRRREETARTDLDRLEEACVNALLNDRVTRNCAIDVAALGPGIIELTGAVPTVDAGQRAARLLHALEGVRTVVNRLTTGAVEQHLAENRQRRAHGEPALRERHWYGMGVGMGRRRQSDDTEPTRDDDTVERRMRELDVRPEDIAEAAAPDVFSGGGDELHH